MEPLILFLIFLALRIIGAQLAGKAGREEQRQEADTDWQEEMPRQTEQRKLPFEIPTMRQSEPNAETKLPQADRIFIRREKTAEPEAEHRPKRETRREPSPRVSAEPIESGINPLYQARLAMKPTAYAETVIEPIDEPANVPRSANIPTSRERLIEGIILAEVLGRPKAYQNQRRIR